MNLNSYLSEKKVIVENYLETILPSEEHIPIIRDAMRYSLLAGGKRLRPILALMSSELFRSLGEPFGNSADDVLVFGCCIEMIHTYSLIHDDLPAMDNDDYRRGKPTTHKVYGENFAILAGDALLNYAFEIMLKLVAKNPKQEYIKAAETVAAAAGVSGMIGGQCLDLYYENKSIDIETLKTMHNKKTGAMISAPLIIGALLSGADDEDIRRIEAFGKWIGLAFQVADDILDVEGSIEKMGKTIGKDKNSSKSTFVTLYGLEKSKQIAEDIIKEAKDLLSVYGEKAAMLQQLADFIINRES